MSECPTCDRVFDNTHGMRIHHVQAHDESIANDTITCQQCGDDFHVQRDKKDKRDYCSRECFDTWRSNNLTGEDHHRYNRKTVSCDECGSDITKPPSLLEASENNYCSSECKYNALSDKLSKKRTKENNPNWQGKHSTDIIETVCDLCEEEFEQTRHQKQSTEHNFCCRECYHEHLSKTKRGENNFHWRGGYEPYYGETWLPQRRKAIDRDDEQCQDCGMTRDQHYDEHGTDLEVHHKTPIRTFEDTADANTLSNLITLCTTCHMKRENN